VVQGTDQSDPIISAQIAHIFAASDNGPRSKLGLTQQERSAPDNLILLCPTHHGIVDNQHETYPPSTLQAWKSQHEDKFKRPISVESASIAIRLSAASAFVDGAIAGEVLHLQQARFFGEFDRLGYARNLSAKIIGGEYSGGGSLVRCRALAWCARVLSMSEDKNEAQKLLAAARKLSECEEVHIANAFCQAAAGSIQSALSSLALLNSPSAKTAAFQIVLNRDGAAKSMRWLSNAGLGASDFDADGKLTLLQRLIEIENWDDAISVASALTEEDYAQAPILLQASASVYLASALPVEIRASIISQPLFSPKKIPLSSSPVAIENRKAAIEFFGRSAAAAKQLNCVQAQQLALDFALWLRLSDPMTYQDARKELETSLKKGEGLRRLPIALDFGIKLDFQTVEAEINKQTALSGGHTVDTALARLALALTKQNAGEVAKYIETYRDDLLRVLDRTAVTSLEIEMLARSGSTDKANQMLAALNNHGLDEKPYRNLTSIIAESQGADAVATRRAEFENSNSLHDLAQLADALEERGDWVSLADVAELLFQRTGNLQDAERVAVTLNNLELDKRLEMFFSMNESLVSSSRVLTKVKSWMLFRLGDVSGSALLVLKLRTEKDSADLRQLWFNIAVIAGDWDAIGAFVSEQWKNEQSRTAKELIFAAQVGFIVQSPLAKDILFEAANRGQTDADILIGAYSLATNAGIENDSRVAAWFAKGIELSGPDGPVEKATLKDLFDRKPEWDRREADTWRMLTEGAIATFMVARLLRRTLVDLFLRPALANLAEVDPRKRGIIAAFAGTREVTATPILSTYGFDPTSLFT
jgi:hypothetical protein